MRPLELAITSTFAGAISRHSPATGAIAAAAGAAVGFAFLAWARPGASARAVTTAAAVSIDPRMRSPLTARLVRSLHLGRHDHVAYRKVNAPGRAGHIHHGF